MEVREHFFIHGNTPHLALVLLLGDRLGTATVQRGSQEGRYFKEARTVVAPVSEGMAFLGWRVYPGLLRQQRRRLQRQRRLLQRREEAFRRGEIDAGTLQDCVRAMAGPRRFLGFGEPLRTTVDV